MKKISPLGDGDSVSRIVQALVDLDEKEKAAPARQVADKIAKMIIKQSKEKPVIKWTNPSTFALGMKASSSQSVKVETSGVALSSNKVKKGLGSIDPVKGVWVLPNGKTVQLPKGRVLEVLKALIKGAKSYDIPLRGPYCQLVYGPKNLSMVLMRKVDKAKGLGLAFPEDKRPRIEGRKILFCL